MITIPAPPVLRRAAKATAAAALLAGLGLASTACSSTNVDTSAGAPGTTAGTTPTYEIVPDAVVTKGLTEVRRLAADAKVAQATDKAKAQALATQMYDTWFTFEGTVRKNEKDQYLQMEDGLAAIKSGIEKDDAAKIAKGIADLEEGASNYTKAHP